MKAQHRLKVLMITHHRKHKVRFRSHAMARYLARRGHDVHELCISEKQRIGTVVSIDEGVTLVETPDLLWGRGRSGWDPWDTFNRLRYITRLDNDFDLIHCFETRPATIYPALYFQRRQRRRKGETIPLLTDWVDWWGRGGIIDISRPAWYRRTLGPVETYYEEAFRTRADGLTVISHGLAERAIRMGVDPGRILRIPNGTHLDDFPLRDKLACRQHLGIAADIPLLGFSSLDSHLDLDLIMVALHHLKCEFPNIKLLITGRTSEHVMQSAATHGVAEHIFLSGFVPFEALSWYLGACDVFVLPFPDTIYNRGRWPNKIADYMSVGRPVVTNPVGEVGHLLGQHPIGLMTEWDATTFSEAIAVLLRDPARADNMGQQARRLAETTYNWQTLITTLEKFYLNHIDFAQMKVRSAALNWHSSQ